MKSKKPGLFVNFSHFTCIWIRIFNSSHLPIVSRFGQFWGWIRNDLFDIRPLRKIRILNYFLFLIPTSSMYAQYCCWPEILWQVVNNSLLRGLSSMSQGLNNIFQNREATTCHFLPAHPWLYSLLFTKLTKVCNHYVPTLCTSADFPHQIIVNLRHY